MESNPAAFQRKPSRANMDALWKILLTGRWDHLYSDLSDFQRYFI